MTAFVDTVGWMFLLVLVGVCIWFFGFVMPVAVEHDRKVADARHAFIADCLDRHPEARCKEFWEYGRTDLGRK